MYVVDRLSIAGVQYNPNHPTDSMMLSAGGTDHDSDGEEEIIEQNGTMEEIFAIDYRADG